MERYAWKAVLKEGQRKEYIRRHKQIWPEMKDVLKAAGIVNYSIWLSGNELFGYYECEKGSAYAAKIQAESPVVQKWNEFMKDVMLMETDERTDGRSTPSRRGILSRLTGRLKCE